MIQIITAIILIVLFMDYPGILFTALITITATYIYCKKPDLFAALGLYVKMDNIPKNKGAGLSSAEKDFETYEEKFANTEAEIKSRMKPGFENDPEWQKSSEALHKTRAKNRASADIEMRSEIMKEAIEYAEAGKWSEVTRIEQELQDLAAKS